jgi:hypothetical protein
MIAPDGMRWEKISTGFVLRDDTGHTGWILRERFDSDWIATIDGHPLSTRVTFRSGKSHRRVRKFKSADKAATALVFYLASSKPEPSKVQRERAERLAELAGER